MHRKWLRLAGTVALAAALAACSAGSVTGGRTAGGPGESAGRPTGAVTPGSEQDLQINVGDRVFFLEDSSAIGTEGLATLKRQAQWLNRHPQARITVEGHCDQRGTREYNLALGYRRAHAVKDLLIADGVAASRIRTISYGKERPAAVGSSEAAWAQNRRAVTVVE